MKTLTKFKSMQEILLKGGGTFDHHGNLHYGGEHITPSNFSVLGTLVELPAHHSYPAWSIEKEYRDDAFSAHQALRHIVAITTDDDNVIHDMAKAGLENKAPYTIIKVSQKYNERKALSGNPLD